MNDFKFLIGRGKTFYEYTQLVEKIVFSGRKGAAPRSITVTLLDSEGYSQDRAKVYSGDGLTCVLYVDGKERFRGLLMTDTWTNKRVLTLKAYDNCIYLSNNKDSFSYKKKRADQIFKDCLKRLGLKAGDIDNTGYCISELVKKNTSFWDVIQDALSQTYQATGKRYYVSSSQGKISLKRRKNQKNIPTLDISKNIEDYERERSIYDTRTRLKLTTQVTKTKGTSEKVKKTYKNTSLEKKIGMFQDIEQVDSKITRTELQRRINTFKEEKALVKKTMKITAAGNISIISGVCVHIYIPQLNEKRLMYVDEDTHTFERGRHQMKVTLNYAKDIDSAG